MEEVEEKKEESSGTESSGSESDSDSGDENTVEVVVPPGMRAGQRIDVQVPSSAGGGVVAARIPTGAVEGDIFEVYLGDMLIS